MIATLQEYNEGEPLITLMSVMKEEDASWRQVSAFFIEEAKRLSEKSVIRLRTLTPILGNWHKY